MDCLSEGRELTCRLGDPPHHEETVVNESVKMPEPVTFTSNRNFGPSGRREEDSDNADDFDLLDLDDVQSLLPTDERLLDIKNEQRYRLLLTHHFHPSRRPAPPSTPNYILTLSLCSGPAVVVPF